MPPFPDHPPPLVPFNGEAPPAPAWFTDALAHAPERSTVAVEGTAIETLAWGERGKPGLLLMHGNGANADWWSFIAPFFAETHRVAALSWSGMGRSDWRERYSLDLFTAEALAAAEHTGLFDGPTPPVFVGHSFGGMLTLAAAARYGERLAGAVIVDSGIRRPEEQWRGPPQRTRPNAVYATLPEALARFRFAPPQGCENPFIADWIARASLKPAPMPDGSGDGWTWRFDPFMWRGFQYEERAEFLRRSQCPLAMMWGERSKLVTPAVAEYMLSLTPPGTPTVVIPDADHHVMVDQPLATVAALRGLLSVWPG